MVNVVKPDLTATTMAPRQTTIPRVFMWAVLAVSAAPFLLNLLGVDFGSSSGSIDHSAAARLTGAQARELVIRSVSGSYTHTLLEWSATCVALFTVILAFTHFYIRRDVVTPVIGIALFAAGTVDAFHTLAADRLIEATADNTNLIPFTWAISRTFNAIIPISALAMFFFAAKYREGSKERQSFNPVIVASVVMGVLAYSIISYCATSSVLPRTMFPDAVIKRPWDVAPLIVYVVSGLFIYRRFSMRVSSHFTIALWLSVIPDTATQLHMSFGSTMLFDNHFNIAHFLKIVAYAVPCVGLILDYVATYVEADQAKAALGRRAEQLANTNQELAQFASAAAHDLQEPLRMVSSYTELLREDYGDSLDNDGHRYLEYANGGALRMKALIQDLLEFSTTGVDARRVEPVQCSVVLDEALANLQTAIADSGAVVTVGSLPKVEGIHALLVTMFQNLIGNAIKFRGDDTPEIRVEAKLVDGENVITVADNGIGMDPRFTHRIFGMFKRLHTAEKYDGTGIGLAMCKKIIEQHEGRIWVESELGSGTTFHVALPVKFARGARARAQLEATPV